MLSSDACRGMVSDDENDQTVTKEAFEVLQFIAGKRLALGRLTVIDATNVQPEARKPLVELARQYHCLPVAIVLDLPERALPGAQRRASRPGLRPARRPQPEVATAAVAAGLQRGGLPARLRAGDARGGRGGRSSSGCRSGTTSGTSTARSTSSAMSTAAATSWRRCSGGSGTSEARLDDDDPLWGDRTFAHPEGRKAIFLGDLVDRGPRILDTVRLVRNMVVHGSALCVPGNHDMKLVQEAPGQERPDHARAGRHAGRDRRPAGRDAGDRSATELADFLDGLVSHYVLDDGKLVVAHAGMKEEMQGRGSGKVRDFALYGETTGETDEFGLPVRFDWASEYRGQAMVVYGHTPVPEPDWLNRTVNIDTGCVFGGKLTALRYPEKEFVSVPAARTYCEPARPFLPPEPQAPALSAQQAPRRGARRRGRAGQADHPDPAAGQRDDPRGERHRGPGGDEPVRRRPQVADLPAAHHVALRDEPGRRAAGAPGRGVRLLPQRGRPAGRLRGEAHGLAGRRRRLPGRDGGAGAVRRRPPASAASSTPAPAGGSSTTRTWSGSSSTGCGRPSTAADLWAQAGDGLGVPRLRADAVVGQGPGTPADPVRGGGRGGLGLAAPCGHGPGGRRRLAWRARSRTKLAEVEARFRRREQDIDRFVAAYRQYCWPVESLTDLKLAPFHLLATEGHVHTDKDHLWHMETLAEVCRADPELLLATRYKVVDVTDPASQDEGIAWWEELTGRGGEGMVVKPLDVHPQGSPGPHPAGREVPGA